MARVEMLIGGRWRPAAGAYGVPTVVRVESAARIRIGRVLDLGAAG